MKNTIHTIHDCDQRSSEWFSLRSNRLTASKFGAWLASDLTKPNKTNAKAMRQSVCEVIARIYGCEEPPVFESWAMKRGTDPESMARLAFEHTHDMGVTEVGFVSHQKWAVGISPDGLIDGQPHGLEIKCPIPATHIKYLLNDELPSEYSPQVHGSMALMGYDAWWFVSYCPGLPMFAKLIERDKTTEAYANGFAVFDAELKASIAIIEAADDGAQTRGIANTIMGGIEQ